jgi:hypothetical protein
MNERTAPAPPADIPGQGRFWFLAKDETPGQVRVGLKGPYDAEADALQAHPGWRRATVMESAHL